MSNVEFDFKKTGVMTSGDSSGQTFFNCPTTGTSLGAPPLAQNLSTTEPGQEVMMETQDPESSGEEESEPGPLQILVKREGDEGRNSHHRLPDLPEEDEELQSSKGSQNPGSEPFGNLTVTKFPLNNGLHYGNQGGGPYPENLSKQASKGRSLIEQHHQFQFLSSPPQTSPNNESFNNNNNSILSLNNNKEGMKYGHPLGGGKEEKVSQRRNHHSHFQNQEHAHFRNQQNPLHGSGKSERKSPHESKTGSPTPNDLKPESLGPGGLQFLSRSLGSALLNLASLGSLPPVHQDPPTQSHSAPLNLSNGGPAAPYLAHCLGQYSPVPSSSPTATNPNNLPQLILASGNIVQGIQGAQLLIPSPQGLMTQTVLTIPITQPLSPSSLLPQPSPSGLVGTHGNKKTALRPTTTNSPSPTTEFNQHYPHAPLISEKLVGLERNTLGGGSRVMGQNNGFRMSSSATGRREGPTNSSPLISASLNNNHGVSSHHFPPSLHHHHHQSICTPSKLSPCSSQSHDHEDSSDFLDHGSDNDDETMMDGINLDEIKEFAKAFKLRRLSLGLTQTQVGQALSVTEGPAYSQSAICSALAWQLNQSQTSRPTIPLHPQQSMFEKLDITPKSAQKIKPVLENWMKEAEDRYRNGNQNLNEFVGMEPSKKRKRRTSFTPQALEILNTHFERNTHPSGAEITTLAHQLGYEREVIRIWFCNKRQALKNTVRMMSKSGSPV